MKAISVSFHVNLDQLELCRNTGADPGFLGWRLRLTVDGRMPLTDALTSFSLVSKRAAKRHMEFFFLEHDLCRRSKSSVEAVVQLTLFWPKCLSMHGNLLLSQTSKISFLKLMCPLTVVLL